MLPSSLDPKSSEMDRKTEKTCCLVRRAHISACFWEKTDVEFYVTRMKKTIQTATNEKCKNQLMWWHGVASGTIYAEAYVGILERHMLLSRRRLFPGTQCLFQQDNARLHSTQVTTAWLRRHRARVLNWPVCSPDLSPIENVRMQHYE